MKTKLLLLLLSLLSVYALSAQLVITSGAQFSVSGNTQLTLQNTDFINNGNFTAGNSIVSFTGNIISSISGNQLIQFNDLEINKTNNNAVLLQRPVGVSARILFTSGFLNLNGFNADLGTTAHLEGEQENSRVTGPNGGNVLFTANLNAPTGANPANLGIFITSNQNLGNVIIKRGHQSQVNSSGAGNSIFRYYDIVPANNTNLNATLRFNYFDGELNGLNENTISFFKSTDNINWSNIGFNLRDAAADFVEKNSIPSFARFTLSSNNNPLPVLFTLLNANCEQNKVLINWKTAQEQNSSHFNIERSTDGIGWTVIGNLPAAGNSTIEKSYSFTDNAPLQNGVYRIAEYDLDGRPQYTAAIRTSCNAIDMFSIRPNPVSDILFVNIVTGNKSQATIKLFDSKGALVKVQQASLLKGNNQVNIDVKILAKGVYQLVAEWNNGQSKKTVQVLKQ